MQLVGCSGDVDDDAVESSSARRKVASTYVAVELCAGRMPRRADCGRSSVIPDSRAEHGYPSPYVIVAHGGARYQPGHRPATRRARDSPVRRVEPEIAQRRGRRQTVRRVRREARGRESVPPGSSGCRGDRRGTSRRGGLAHLGVPLPAEVDDGCLWCEQFERALQARRRRARVHGEVATPFGLLRRANSTPGRRDARPLRVDVHRVERTRETAASRATQQPSIRRRRLRPGHPQAGGIPERVDRRLDDAPRTTRAGGIPSARPSNQPAT
jgi:hypothetical protein